MKLAFLSDIHGNATALEAVLNDIKNREVEKIYVLGDICYRGIDPQRSIDLIKSLNTDVIKGNADEWVVRGVKVGEVPEQALQIMNKERDWTLSKLNEDSLDYLRTLPTDLKLVINGVKIHAFHATPSDLFKVVLPNESDENLISKLMIEEADIYIYAHIHKSYIRFINGKCLINIGSVGLPFDGLGMPTYLILNINDKFIETNIVRVKYDVNSVIENLEESDYPNKTMLVTLLQNTKV